MEGSTDEGVLGDVAGDRIVDLADDWLVTADLGVWAGTQAEVTPAWLDVRRVDHPRGVVLTLGGELDIASVPALQERLDRAMCGKAAVVIDLSGLRFIDSSGLDLLVRTERHLRDSGARLVLVRGPRAVHRVFALTRLDSHFEFCDSPSAALRTVVGRRKWSPADPPAGSNRQTAAELDRDLPGVTWS